MFKKFCLYITCFMLLSAFQCHEDEIETLATIELPATATIEGNQSIFQLDDEITVKTIIPNSVISTDGESLLLSDFLVEQEQLLRYWLYVYKDIGKDFLQGVQIATAQAQIGGVEYSETGAYYGMSIKNTYDADEDAFLSEIKFKMIEPGNYLFGGGYYDSYTKHQKIKMIINTQANTEVEIFSSIVNANTEGLYEFTVQ